MRILHTSDWHLGKTLYGKQRYNEFESFLNWLIDTIITNNIELLLVSGDIFDTTTPGTKAQELYYKFLTKITNTKCQNVVIIAGNHDSPTFLTAPKELLKYHNIYIVGEVNKIEDEVIEIKNSHGEQEAIVCAVPYLRDRYIRDTEQYESIEDKSLKLVEAIKNHYEKVADYAQLINKNSNPVIAMGHLFAAGGKTLDGDGVRELYVGTLSHVGADIFPEIFKYVALGHLHVPQIIGGQENIRYSGSPIAMGFGEAKQSKKVIIIDINSNEMDIIEIIVPTFQMLEKISGDKEKIFNRIAEIKVNNSSIWLEIEYTGKEILPNLQDEIYSMVEGSLIEIRLVKNRAINNTNINIEDLEDLETLGVEEVFNRCLTVNEITENEISNLKQMFLDVYNLVEEGESED